MDHRGQRLLTVAQVAARLATSRSKLYELIGRGEIDSVRIGASRRISERAVDDYIARLEGRAAAGPS